MTHSNKNWRYMLPHDEPPCYVHKGARQRLYSVIQFEISEKGKSVEIESRYVFACCWGDRNTDLLPSLFSGDGNVLKFERDNGCTTL